MITVISGTNRLHSQTLVIAEYARLIASDLGMEQVSLLDLCRLNGESIIGGGYSVEDLSPITLHIQDGMIVPARAFYIVVPEYNGSFPGILKYFLDACSVRRDINSFSGKKAAILGLSSGRAGNLRGMDHLTSILHYLNMHVMPNRLPVSRIEGLIKGEKLMDPESRHLIKTHIEEFVEFCG